MTVVNSHALLAEPPIIGMSVVKKRCDLGVSHGLAEVGYDIRIKQTVRFSGNRVSVPSVQVDGEYKPGNFTLASAMEEFRVPRELTGIVHDKSTWARHGLSVFNTVIEPGWNGFLTLELVYHGQEELIIPAGSGIAQVVFHRLEVPALYKGNYQDQEDRPVPSIVPPVTNPL